MIRENILSDVLDESIIRFRVVVRGLAGQGRQLHVQTGRHCLHVSVRTYRWPVLIQTRQVLNLFDCFVNPLGMPGVC